MVVLISWMVSGEIHSPRMYYSFSFLPIQMRQLCHRLRSIEF